MVQFARGSLYTQPNRKNGRSKQTQSCSRSAVQQCINLCTVSSLIMLLGGTVIGYILGMMIGHAFIPMKDVTHSPPFSHSNVMDENKDIIQHRDSLRKGGRVEGKGGIEVKANTSTSTSTSALDDLHNEDVSVNTNINDYKLQMKPIPKTKIKQYSNSQAVLGTAQSRIVENQEFLSSQSVPTTTTPHIIHTAQLPESKKKKILVTGGAGFVGSHLVDKLMGLGHEVIVLDNFFTGQKRNIEHWLHHPNFSLIVHDVTEPIMAEVDEIYHLACPASPPHYQYNPVKTIKTSTMGTINMLGLAKRVKARMLLTSTSEVYGDPTVHPQPESYWGNVNTIGPRSCYDEGKRVAETMMYSYQKQNGVDVRVARIFNTFGPRMHPNDGRVVSNFIIQSLQNKDLTIYGDGEQTRSFQYVSDLVDGLHKLMEGKYDQPVNLGNPDEYTVGNFAKYIKNLTNSESEIVFLDHSQDDPTQRKPVIDVAREQLGWSPVVKVEDGLKKTIEYFRGVLDESGEIIPTGPGAAKPKGGD